VALWSIDVELFTEDDFQFALSQSCRVLEFTKERRFLFKKNKVFSSLQMLLYQLSASMAINKRIYSCQRYLSDSGIYERYKLLSLKSLVFAKQDTSFHIIKECREKLNEVGFILPYLLFLTLLRRFLVLEMVYFLMNLNLDLKKRRYFLFSFFSFSHSFSIYKSFYIATLKIF